MNININGHGMCSVRAIVLALTMAAVAAVAEVAAVGAVAVVAAVSEVTAMRAVAGIVNYHKQVAGGSVPKIHHH